MKKNDYDMFKVQLSLNMEIDSSLRSISEKINLLRRLGRSDVLTSVSSFLKDADSLVDSAIHESLESSDHEDQ